MVVSEVFVRNLYCQLHSILAQLASAVRTCRANFRGSESTYGGKRLCGCRKRGCSWTEAV